MGRGIVYCASCGNKILDRDFESRAAFHLDGRGFCKNCAPGALKSLPPDKMAEVLAQISEAESSKRRPAPSRPAVPAPAPATRRHAPEASRTPLIAGLALAGVVVVLLLVMMLSRSDPPPAPPPPPPTIVERPPKVDRDALAAQALQKARDFRDAHPKEFATQLAGFQRVTEEFKGTRAADDARRDLEEARRRAEDALFAPLRQRAQALQEAEEFQAAIDALRKDRDLPLLPTAEIDRMIAEIRAAAHKSYPALKEQAIAQRRAGDETGVQNAKERVSKWGFPEYVSGLEAALSAVPISAKRPLINGRDTTGWSFTRGRWVCKDGMLQTVELDDKDRAFVAIADALGDFELEGMIEAPTVRTYTEFNARGADWTAAMHLEIGWHKFRVVAAAMDVKLFVDEKPVPLSKGNTPRGQFGIFSLGAVRLKDVMIRP
jgi:hypothetical protein